MSIQPIVPDAPLAARAGCGDRRHCRGPSETASRRHPVDDGSCPAHRLFGGFRRAASDAQPRLPATCNGPCLPAPARRLALWCSRLPPTPFQARTRLLGPSRGRSRFGAVRRAATPRTSRSWARCRRGSRPRHRGELPGRRVSRAAAATGPAASWPPGRRLPASTRAIEEDPAVALHGLAHALRHRGRHLQCRGEAHARCGPVWGSWAGLVSSPGGAAALPAPVGTEGDRRRCRSRRRGA